jgi:Ca2+-binding RTX toxin-like protein
LNALRWLNYNREITSFSSFFNLHDSIAPSQLHQENTMALLISFQGLTYATNTAEAFYAEGPFDTVSYESAPSAGKVGDYDVGVTVNFTDPYLNTGWAQGDKFYFGSIEKIIGSQHTDFLYGDAQANTFDGGGSPDFIYGRGGNDSLLGGGGFDFLSGETGDDVLNGQWQTDTLYGGDGNDKLWGGSNYVSHFYPGTNYADVLFGDAGNDELHGDVLLPGSGKRSEYYAPSDFMPGSDELHGGTGDDMLNGDGGNDKLWGDAGRDTFRFDKPYTVLDASGANMRITSGDDVVMDFNPGEDGLSFGGQSYTTADTSNGIVITLGDAAAPAGHVTLWHVHTFQAAWIV